MSEKITIRTELSIENAVKLYNALNPIGQRGFFGNLSNADAKHLQTAIRADHAEKDYNCSCFACVDNENPKGGDETMSVAHKTLSETI